MTKLASSGNPKIQPQYLGLMEFGQSLLDTGDLDPIYYILHWAQFPVNVLYRWLLAYWCFYDVGVASWITTGNSLVPPPPKVDPRCEIMYWDRMKEAAGSREYRRGAERRHFRGRNASQSVEWLESQGLDNLFKPLVPSTAYSGRRRLRAVEVMDTVKRWKGFGPWIAFKVADMLERLGIVDIDFEEDQSLLFDAPREGAMRYWVQEHDEEAEPASTEKAVSWTISKVKQHFSKIYAPPSYDRLVNLQEVETMLCKWKSHLNGHYQIGTDTLHIRKSLESYVQVSWVALKLFKLSAKLPLTPDPGIDGPPKIQKS